MPKISIIVPVRNEEKNIEKLVTKVHESLSSNNISYELLLIDDHSTDNTTDVARELQKKYPIQLFLKQGTRGKAFSILEGVTYARSDILCMIDADLQYDPRHIPQMLAEIEADDKVGIVVAERKKYNGKFLRRLASRTNAFLTGKLLFGFNHDIQSGLKLFRKDIVSHVEVKSVGPWSLDIPLLHAARMMGYKIRSLPITFEHRESGDSKIDMMSVAFEIFSKALHLKLAHKKTLTIDPHSAESMIGAGFFHKQKEFITHSTLHHNSSAVHTLKTWQKVALVSLLGIFILAFTFNAITALIVLMAILSSIYFIDVIFNLYMVLKSLHFPYEISVNSDAIEQLKNSDLPVYTILCPLYKEAHMIPQFVKAISQLEWPKNKLDVMLLLEEDDVQTIEAAKKISLPAYCRIVVVPDSQPKTKPKATNYGLAHAKGEYVVIYDAEDIPDPLQLKKAYIAFQQVNENVVCLQAKLNYYNPHQNLLTRLFTAEYSLWFDVILPGLQAMQTTIPLGGTSNHFRTSRIKEIEGWDPFNVTEDCDLGVRLFKRGYTTAIIDSTTLEEANSNVRNWIRQRSRWIKGYIQTYFVHMREPITFSRNHGLHAVLFNLIVGGKIAFLFINPLLWLTTIAYFTLYALVGPQIEALFPSVVFYMAVISLIFGNFFYLYYYMIGSAKRGHWSLIKFIFLVPFYWLLVSTAAVMALFQLIFKPHYWEKTIHGLHLDQSLANAPEKIEAPKKQHVSRNLAGSSALIVASFVGYGLNFLTNLYLGRTISAEAFSLVSLMSSFFFCAAILLGPLANTVTHQTAYIRGKYHAVAKTFWMKVKKVSLIGALIIIALWIVNLYNLMGFFQSTAILPFILFTPVWFITTLISLDRGFILGNQVFGLVAFIVVLEALAKLVLSVLLVNFGYSDFVYAAMPLSLLITLFVLLLLTKKFTLNKDTEISSITRFPKKFFATSLITSTATIAFLSLDLILAKHYLSVEEAGEYALLAFVGKIIFFVGTVFSQFINPVISQRKGENRDTLRVFYAILTGIFIPTVLSYLILGYFAEYSLPLLFGSKVQNILPFANEYGLALMFLALGSAFVNYHQSRKEYLHSIFGLAIVPSQVIGIMMFHDNVGMFIHVLFIISVTYFMLSLLLHTFYGLVVAIINNFRDLFDLFKANPKSKQVKSRYRILMLNWRDTQHVWAGGAEVYIHNIAKEWVKEGHQVTIFCGNDGHHPRNQVIDGIQIIRRGGFYTVYTWAFIYYMLRLRSYFDVVVDCQNGVPFFTPLYVHKPIVLLMHHVHQEVFSAHLPAGLNTLARLIESKLMPIMYRNTTIVTVSNSSKKEMVKLGIGSGDAIAIVNPGVDTGSFKKMSKTKHPSFVYLGRLKKYKNVDIIVRAFVSIVKKYPESKLTIAGSGEEVSNLKNLSKSLAIEDNVLFVNQISEERKRVLFAESWAALQPSMIEGFGITVIEANAAGTPVIASNVNGLRDSVKDKVTGLLVKPLNVDAFSQAMMEIIENSANRKKLSHNAYDWAQTFEWKNSSQKFLTLLDGTARAHHIHLSRKYARVHA